MTERGSAEIIRDAIDADILKNIEKKAKQMIFLYTMPMCGACEERKAELRKTHTENWQERKGERLQLDPRVFDAIDKEAFSNLQMQHGTFPVEIDGADVEGYDQ